MVSCATPPERSVERDETPDTLGMLRKVRHLVRIEEA